MKQKRDSKRDSKKEENAPSDHHHNIEHVNSKDRDIVPLTFPKIKPEVGISAYLLSKLYEKEPMYVFKNYLHNNYHQLNIQAESN